MPKPRRPYGALIDSLSKVWKIRPVDDSDAFLLAGTASLPCLQSQDLKIAVWNLCKGSGGYQFEHDFKSISRRNDLILTQEALLSPRSIKTFLAPGFALTHAASYARTDGLRDGVMTISRSCSDSSYLRRIRCKYPEPFLKTPKVALVQKFPLAGQDHQLLVINIHATLIRSVKATIEEMQHIISFLPQHDGPVIFAGDFNTFSSKYLKAICQELRVYGLNLVPIENDPRARTQALDQVFVRDLKVKSIKIEDSYLNSDHFPIFLSVST